MPKFKIPCVWKCWGLMSVEADTLKEAIDYAIDKGSLPEGDYIDDSFEIDTDGLEIYNETDETQLTKEKTT